MSKVLIFEITSNLHILNKITNCELPVNILMSQRYFVLNIVFGYHDIFSDDYDQIETRVTKAPGLYLFTIK